MSAVLQPSAGTAAPSGTMIVRRSLHDVFREAASGQTPRQPHDNETLLQQEARLAGDILQKIGADLAGTLKGRYRRGPEKEMERVRAKMRGRGYDLSYNHDYARSCIHLRSNDQIRRAIDLFHRPGPIALAGGMTIHVLDVDNTFVRENPKKPGLRNLDLKIAVPVTLEDGTETYHIAELQFLRKGTERAYEHSHAIYKMARSELLRRQWIENAMDMAGDPKTLKSLEHHWIAADRNYTALMQDRTDINLAVARKLGLDELIGYQPCNSCVAQKVEKSPEKGYDLHV